MSLDLEPGPILEAALAQGGEMAELFIEHSTTLSVVMDDGQVEKVVGGVDRGAGLRLIRDLRTSYAHTNQVDRAGLLPLARNLAALGSGPAVGLAPWRESTPGLVTQVLKSPAQVQTAAKVEMVRAAEAAARALDPRLRQVRVTYSDRVQEVRIVNSLGVEVRDRRVYVVLAVHCVAGEGQLIQTGYESAGGMGGLEIIEAEDPEEVARVAARRAILMLEADPAPGGAMPVVLAASAGGTMIHEAVGHGLEGDAVCDGQSVYAGRMGQQVASPLISVVDDGAIPGRRGSFGFDDEGVPSRRNLLIENGVLRGWMHDRLSALRMNEEPSGNGRRESYRHRPVPRMSNTMILPGAGDLESILGETPQGLLVSKMGGGQVNTVNGDFVFEVSEGYLIKNGQQSTPVRGATLTGNGPAVLMDIDRVAGDLGYSLGTCGKDGQGAPVADAQPSLRIPRMVVGGQHG